MNSANTFRGVSRQIPGKALSKDAGRSMHVVSSSNIKLMKMARSPHKTSQNGFAALAPQEQSPQLSTARDIELLLSNIGASHRASRPTIESMMQGSGARSTREPQRCNLTGNEIIDLIAQIRSI
ncbi:hypothetical protein HJC23_005706 [Cyclotella cryptica]|uniref:Uncharacterized protein n=1 Tax=Cyclotella cryptica TaxID=29204 RepID=A0ABD3QD92_9STRA|eukprot:CCRYP_006413-RA/>CCRYP_006413-RA protein AED:0.40 eAED:0.40 QI:329/1/1/1/1/1/2/435/123